MMSAKLTSSNNLAKTQKIPNLAAIQKGVAVSGIKDQEAVKLIEDYKKIDSALRLVVRFNPLNPLIFLLIKKRLVGLVQQEFELYNSFPELVKNRKLQESSEVVSSRLQGELSFISKSISNRLNEAIKRKMLQRQYMREVYRYSLPPIMLSEKTRRAKNVFNSVSYKKRFY